MLSLGVVIGVLADHHSGGDVWFFDACVALGVSAVLLIYGVLILVKNARIGNHWWTAAFWRTVPSVRAKRHVEHSTRLEGVGVESGGGLDELTVEVKD